MDIKSIREKAFLTLEDMAKELGVSVMSVWKWENGSEPSKKNKKKIKYLCEKYGI